MSASCPNLLHLPLDVRRLILHRLPLPDALNFCAALPDPDHSQLVRQRVARLRPLRDAWVRSAPGARLFRDEPHLRTRNQRAALSPALFARLNVLRCSSPLSDISAVSELRDMQLLDLSHCRLRHIPSAIRHCTQLRFLNLSHNSLKAFPISVLLLPKLETLLLHFNNIPELPSDWGNVPYLHRLGLHGCGVQGPLPDQLCRMLGTYTEHRASRSANLRGHGLDDTCILALFRRFPNLSSSLIV
ncbi:unnamed protein product [Agarophyton chilense]